MAQLKLWVNYLCQHPVLSQSEVWQHFLNCTDEKVQNIILRDNIYMAEEV